MWCFSQSQWITVKLVGWVACKAETVLEKCILFIVQKCINEKRPTKLQVRAQIAFITQTQLTPVLNERFSISVTSLKHFVCVYIFYSFIIFVLWYKYTELQLCSTTALSFGSVCSLMFSLAAQVYKIFLQYICYICYISCSSELKRFLSALKPWLRCWLYGSWSYGSCALTCQN